jgi:hypothetical protein
MSTAIRGTVLAGRYRLEERIHSGPDGAHWRAVDATLDRRVSIRVMRPGHPFSAAAADAARRAALVDDDRLVRVLDVGTDGQMGFVVSEDVEGDSLASLVERSPLAPPAVRRIIGEVAQGLDAAAARGLHHLQLTPRSVIVCRDGSVKIAGTAVEAAAAGLEPDHAASANRTDAIALVGLLYSGLTGRWPLGAPGFPPAPRGEGGAPVPPADLVPGIPNDLDTICVVTLGGSDDGPLTPAELATQLAPWLPADEAPLRAAGRRLPADAPTGPPGPDSPLKIRPSKRGAKSARAGRPLPPAVTNGTDASNGAGEAASGSTPRRSASLFSTPSVAATGQLPIPKEPPAAGPRRMDSLFTQQTVYPGTASPAGSQPSPAAEESPRNPKSAFGSIPPIEAPPITASPPRWSAPVARAPRGKDALPTEPPPADEPNLPGMPPLDRSDEGDHAVERAGGQGRAADPPRLAGPPGSTQVSDRDDPDAPEWQRKFDPLVPWGPGWHNDAGPPSAVEATGPFPILIPPESPPREQSRLVIFSVALVLVLGLLVAAFSLRDLGSSGNAGPVETNTPLPSSTVAALEPTTEPPTPTPTVTTPTPTPAAVPVSLAKIGTIDPEGDGEENTDRSPRAVDGDPSTSWFSKTYTSADFGGLKQGVGLTFRLKKPAAVSSATIDFNGTGGQVELRTASGPDLGSSVRVGKATMRNGQVTVEADGAKAAKYVILWFTELPSVEGQYKVEVSEVRLK